MVILVMISMTIIEISTCDYVINPYGFALAFDCLMSVLLTVEALGDLVLGTGTFCDVSCVLDVKSVGNALVGFDDIVKV